MKGCSFTTFKNNCEKVYRKVYSSKQSQYSTTNHISLDTKKIQKVNIFQIIHCAGSEGIKDTPTVFIPWEC